MTAVVGAFTPDQMEFLALAGKVFASTVDLSSAAAGKFRDTRDALAELGLPLLAVPDALGGGGLDEVDIVLILEEAGYADVPVPIAETVGLVAPLVARHGTDEQRAHWLPALASGEVLGGSWCPTNGLGSRQGIDVALAEHEGRVVVLDLRGLTEGPGPIAELVKAGRSTDLGSGDACVTELRARGAWVAAALLNGVSRRLLDLSLEYARTREQFGVPIGTFQAVKHMLAEMAAVIESGRASAWSAARALAGEAPSYEVVTSVAKVASNRAGAVANEHALQLHGGIGFTEEHPLHRWLIHGHELESRWGASPEHQRLLGRNALAGGSLVSFFVP